MRLRAKGLMNEITILAAAACSLSDRSGEESGTGDGEMGFSEGA